MSLLSRLINGVRSWNEVFRTEVPFPPFSANSLGVQPLASLVGSLNASVFTVRPIVQYRTLFEPFDIQAV